MIKWYLEYIGLWPESNTKTQPVEKYIPVHQRNIAEKYLKYLEDLAIYQKDRKQTIENKNSLLIGQASIVFSIVGLFIPLFNGQLNGLNVYLIYFATIIFLNALVHFILTIFFAIRNLEIDKMRYAVGSTTTVTKSSRNLREVDFMNEQIKDLVFSINYNIKQIDIIGDNLIHASRCFKIANLNFFILTIVLIILFAFKKNDTPKVEVINLQQICCSKTDSTSSNQVINSITLMQNELKLEIKRIDSLALKIDLLIGMQKKGCSPIKPRKSKSPCP